MFIDQAKVYVKAGAGGRGCQSLYRDKYARKGIPDGGDGGKGADIIVRADKKLYTLLDFKYKRHFYGKHGQHGSGNNKRGRGAEDIVIRVPLGTIIRDIRANCVLRDLTVDQQELIVARGGKGGRGNQHHQEATEGIAGEEKELLLDLKIIADVGVVGFPNAGKSTLICSISGAHSKIAGYHFTTKSPVLGVVKSQDKVFVAADMPGLIEGASEGRGLGDKFLRHIERTGILIHLVDMSGCEGRDPLEDYRILNKELEVYKSDVGNKPQVIAANKMDLEGAEGNLARFKKQVKKKVYPVSALQKRGLEELVEAVAKKI
ncbi:MAG: GTPase ObgE [Candidatus Omnitrophica bacterium]|nr:GTPase ObgE [Candidatus Omnitrophota bacterium]